MRTNHIILYKGQDIQQEIRNHLLQEECQKGTIVSCIGLLSSVYLSLDGETGRQINGLLGIAQLSGMIWQEEDHLHISLFDEEGRPLIGHLLKEAIVEEETHIVLGIIE